MTTPRIHTEILEERRKALLVRAADGRTGWIQRRWRRADGTVSSPVLAKAAAKRGEWAVERQEGRDASKVSFALPKADWENGRSLGFDVIGWNAGRQSDWSQRVFVPKTRCEQRDGVWYAPIGLVDWAITKMLEKGIVQGPLQFEGLIAARDDARDEVKVDAKRAVEIAEKASHTSEETLFAAVAERASDAANAEKAQAAMDAGEELKTADAELNFDGGCEGNPGPMALGIAGTVLGEAVGAGDDTVGHGTNNQAEWQAFIWALTYALNFGAKTLIVKGDSRLVVEQMLGNWKIKVDVLRVCRADALALVSKFDAVRIEWVSRDENEAADSYASMAS